MSEIYNRIVALGKLRGYKNMTVLCSSAGVPRSTMTEINKGRSKDLGIENAQKFAALLNVSLDEIYGIKKTPTETGEGVTDEDIKFALFGGDGAITDEMYDEVKKFAAYVKERERKKNDN